MSQKTGPFLTFVAPAYDTERPSIYQYVQYFIWSKHGI